MVKDFNSPKIVEAYDEHIRKLIPGYEIIHQQVDAILQSVLQPTAHILIVGCGTGYELEYLLNKHPDWTFTALDPSLAMLETTETRVKHMGKSAQVQFVHGDHSTLTEAAVFDAALSILVAHFIADKQKNEFYSSIHRCLKRSGLLLTYDLMPCNNPQHLQALRYLCMTQGLTELQCQKMLDRMENDFFTISFSEYQQRLQDIGFEDVHSYSQILMYQGLIAKKAEITEFA
ncbi:class I SAM-dependent methyltransferase [uncultured Acinetobacter sp.]|uniref:class I SAM-dependent methyltransferase n=1 Tax=uncultured Acinetobacter sp. TaxID=165433 RepID=UPI0025902F5A|nr:class I SAM-dependent methyltransferase [uncultured Acinetobacter sp.]